MSPFFLHRFDRIVKGKSIDVLAIYVADAELNGTYLVGEIEQEIERSLAPDEVILIVREASFAKAKESLQNDIELATLRERLEGRSSLTLVAYSAHGNETAREALSNAGTVSDVTLDEIRRRGATDIFRERGGFMEANPSFHFENPSKHHTDRFIRLSNILVRQAEIDFLAFCILPLVPAGSLQAYVDTPALFAVVGSLNEQRAPAGLPRMRTDNFRSYEGVDSFNFTAIDSSIALISASSSGSLAKRLEIRGFESSQIIHVLFLGKDATGLNVAANISRADENPRGYEAARQMFEKGKCALCDAGSTAIQLRGDQFDIAAPQPEPVTVKRADAPEELADRMFRLVGAKALGVSLGGRSGRGLFFIDAKRLVERPASRDRIKYFIQRYVPASVAACVAIDDQSGDLANFISEVNGRAMAVIPRIQIDQSDLGGAGAILVAASVIESGRILLDVSRDLRNQCPDRPIIYFVGVSKSPSAEHRDTLRNNLIQTEGPTKHQFTVVEDFLLPPPTTSNAWEQELAFLNRTEGDWPIYARDALKARQARLRSSATPLVNEIFVANGIEPLKLRLGFAFWPDGLPKEQYTQGDVFFTIASVLQNLRTNKKAGKSQALTTGWFRQTPLSPENFGRYNDGIIQASFLRAARPGEMDYRNDPVLSDLAYRIIRRILASSNRPRGEAAAEFLIAIGSGRLRLADEQLAQLLEPVADENALVNGLLEICRKTLT